MLASKAAIPPANPIQSVVIATDLGQSLGCELALIELHQHPEQCQLLKGFQWGVT